MSDFPESPQDPFVSAQVVEKRGMSGGTKVLLVLGIIFLVCIVVCCGGGIIASFVIGQAAKDMVTEDPVVIAQRQADTLDIQIPDAFEPQASMDMAFAGMRFMIMVIYEGQSAGDSLVLVGIGETLANMPEQDMERQIQDSLRQQGIGEVPSETGATWEMETKEFAIGNEPVEFLYRTEKNEDEEPYRYHVTGTVTGKEGPVLVTLTVSADTMTEEEIDGMIESIQ